MRGVACLCALQLITGCGGEPPDPVPAPVGPLFCEVEEARRFTQEELDVRSARWPANLRRDFKTNTAIDAECMKGENDGD